MYGIHFSAEWREEKEWMIERDICLVCQQRYKFSHLHAMLKGIKCDFSSCFRKHREKIIVELNREEINWRNYINNTRERKENSKHIEIYTSNVFVVVKLFVGRLLVFSSLFFHISHCTILSMSLPTEGIKNESKNKNTTLRFNHCQSVENKTNDYDREFLLFFG